MVLTSHIGVSYFRGASIELGTVGYLYSKNKQVTFKQDIIKIDQTIAIRYSTPDTHLYNAAIVFLFQISYNFCGCLFIWHFEQLSGYPVKTSS